MCSSDPDEVGLAAFRRSLSLRGCGASVAGLAAWPRGERVSISSRLVFAQDLSSETEAAIQGTVLDISSSALRALGFNVVPGETGGNVVDIEAFGAAEGANYYGIG